MFSSSEEHVPQSTAHEKRARHRIEVGAEVSVEGLGDEPCVGQVADVSEDGIGLRIAGIGDTASLVGSELTIHCDRISQRGIVRHGGLDGELGLEWNESGYEYKEELVDGVLDELSHLAELLDAKEYDKIVETSKRLRKERQEPELVDAVSKCCEQIEEAVSRVNQNETRERIAIRTALGELGSRCIDVLLR